MELASVHSFLADAAQRAAALLETATAASSEDIDGAAAPDGALQAAESAQTGVQEGVEAAVSAAAESDSIQAGVQWFAGTFDQSAFGVHLWQVLAVLGAALACYVLVRIIFAVLTRKKGPLTQKFGPRWTDQVAVRLFRPCFLVALSGVLAVISPYLRLSSGAASVMGFLVKILAVLPCVWGLYRSVDLFCDRLASNAAAGKTRIDKDAVPLIRQTLQTIVVLLGLLFILQNLGVDVGSLLAGLGIGGIAIAMAAKDTLSNFFGSLVLIGDRPFKVGDRIQVNGVDGDVASVGLRSTRVHTYYDSIVALPNSKLADSTIDNQGVRKFRRTSTYLGVSYDTTPEQMVAFIEGIRAIIRANEYSRKDSYEVAFTDFGAYSLNILLYYFVQNISWRVELKAKQDINLEIMRLAKALKVEFAFPTQTLQHQYVAAPGAPKDVPEALNLSEMKKVVRGFGPGGALSTPATPPVDGDWTVEYDPREMTEDGTLAQGAPSAAPKQAQIQAPQQTQEKAP